jgi:hypothetical protein
LGHEPRQADNAQEHPEKTDRRRDHRLVEECADAGPENLARRHWHDETDADGGGDAGQEPQRDQRRHHPRQQHDEADDGQPCPVQESRALSHVVPASVQKANSGVVTAAGCGR